MIRVSASLSAQAKGAAEKTSTVAKPINGNRGMRVELGNKLCGRPLRGQPGISGVWHRRAKGETGARRFPSKGYSFGDSSLRKSESYLRGNRPICLGEHLSRRCIHFSAKCVMRAVRVYFAENPAAVATRVRELLRQSEKYQTELERLAEEFERLQGQIADIGSEKLRDSEPGEREERRA
jgi:hypothetical protein